MYLYLKALHIIFVVCWFAGLFYIVRLFVYYAEAQQKTALEKEILSKQYQIMTHRLWFIITYPAAVLATIFGVWMLIENPALLKMPWMHRSEEHTSELQSRPHLVCRLLLEKKKKKYTITRA